MDGKRGQQVDVEAGVREIKQHMPSTYKSIQAKADEVGRSAYGLVRRSIAGEPDLFWACERGWVMGTPFKVPDITSDAAFAMVRFGAQSLVIWAKPDAKGGADGTQ